STADRKNCARQLEKCGSFLCFETFNDDKSNSERSCKERVDFQRNVLQFYGIANEVTDADDGSLNAYLKLEWIDKYRLALQLASAVECMHECDGTPIEYSNLFQACWNCDPSERLKIQKVVLSLRKIISLEQSIANKEGKNDSSTKGESNLKSNKLTSSINKELTISNSFDNIEPEGNPRIDSNIRIFHQI
ncbi:15769_t:CDS:2, partial [Funneliformis mosseae]